MATIAAAELTKDGSSAVFKKAVIDTNQTAVDLVSVYRPNVHARQIIIQRTTAAPPASRQFSRESASRYGGYYNSGSSTYLAASTTGVNAVKDARDREKKDMQDLNERLANYIEKGRFLEAQNRKLVDELEKLKSKWGKESIVIKAMFEGELAEARRLYNEVVAEKSRIEIRLSSVDVTIVELNLRLEESIRDLVSARETIDRQNQQLADYEGELGLLRRRLGALENDRDKDKNLNKKLQELLNATRADLDNETLLHIDAENRRQTLEEELEFLKAVHDQELKELQALVYRDTTGENREYWKTEMGQAMREIQSTYDDKLDGMRLELETYYNLKLQQFQTGSTKGNMEIIHSKEESKRLRDQLGALREKLADHENKVAQLLRELDQLRREKEERERELDADNVRLNEENVRYRAEMEAMMKEIQNMLDTKLGLELEIMAYRRLLEGEETRTGLRQAIDSLPGQPGHAGLREAIDSLPTTDSVYTVRHAEKTSGDSSAKVSQITKGEISAKTTYQKSAKGPVAIYEISLDAKYVALENNGRKDETLGGWSLTRNIDGKDVGTYRFKEGFILKPGEKIKVWSKGSKTVVATSSDLEADIDWGIGGHVTTKLVSPTGEDRASHIQKTDYASS